MLQTCRCVAGNAAPFRRQAAVSGVPQNKGLLPRALFGRFHQRTSKQLGSTNTTYCCIQQYLTRQYSIPFSDLFRRQLPPSSLVLYRQYSTYRRHPPLLFALTTQRGRSRRGAPGSRLGCRPRFRSFSRERSVQRRGRAGRLAPTSRLFCPR